MTLRDGLTSARMRLRVRMILWRDLVLVNDWCRHCGSRPAVAEMAGFCGRDCADIWCQSQWLV